MSSRTWASSASELSAQRYAKGTRASALQASALNAQQAPRRIGSLTYAGAAGGVLYDGTSPLYGATEFGGSNEPQGEGVLFALQPKEGARKWPEKVIYNFVRSRCATKSTERDAWQRRCAQNDQFL